MAPEPCELCGIPIQNIRSETNIGPVAVIDFKRPPGPCWYEVIATSPTSVQWEWHSPERCVEWRKVIDELGQTRR